MEAGSISKKIAVVSVLWQGSFRGRDYSPEWVKKLYCMVGRNTAYPFDFYCFSNVEQDMGENINLVPLRKGWPGWWSKMEIFGSEALQGYDLVVFFDLDVLIIDTIDDIIRTGLESSSICFAPQAGRKRVAINNEGKRQVYRYRTGVFTFKPHRVGKYTGIFYEQDIDKYRGDQDWWGDFCNDAELFPAEWFMKTKHIDRGARMPDKKVIFCNPVKNPEAVRVWDWAARVWAC